MTIFETLVKRIQAAGDVDLSAEIEPCMFGEDEAQPLENDVISTVDCVKECQKVSAEWREHMRRLGIEV